MIYFLMAIQDTDQREKCEKIFLKYEKRMHYHAKKILREDYAAEEAVQKAFEKLIPHLHKIKDVDSDKTQGFLYIIVRNIAFDMYNERKRSQDISIEDVFDAADEQEPSVSEAVISKNDYEKLIETVKEELSPIYRDTFLLKYSHGYDNKEIAAFLQINEVAVRKRLETARKKLAKILREEMEE